MSMARQLKDKKIIIYREETISHPGSMPTLGYAPIHPGSLWAYVRQLSANEVFAAKAVQQTEEMLFIVNWRADITQWCSVFYKGIFYNISRVDSFEGYKDNLKLYATAKEDQPDPSDVYPYPGG
jgi:SPP1 family predicted phage head-tail adaptor